MASSDLDASEDVNDFLLRIRELGEKRDKEDEERTKKLEEEILQGRKEREARRAGTWFPIVFVSLSSLPTSSPCAAAFSRLTFHSHVPSRMSEADPL